MPHTRRTTSKPPGSLADHHHPPRNNPSESESQTREPDLSNPGPLRPAAPKARDRAHLDPAKDPIVTRPAPGAGPRQQHPPPEGKPPREDPTGIHQPNPRTRPGPSLSRRTTSVTTGLTTSSRASSEESSGIGAGTQGGRTTSSTWRNAA